MSLVERQPITADYRESARHLFGPVADFMMLGGSSLIILPILLLLPVDQVKPGFVAATFLLSLVINYPHFAVSYRIFYENFATKVAAGHSPDPTLRYRYVFAGIVAPVVIVAVMLSAILRGDGQTLAWSFNVMVFFVGWHYVKQGYGMAMVDAVLKKRFFSDSEKKTFLANGYAVWFTAWALSNRTDDVIDYLGVDVANWKFPGVVLAAAVAATVATSAATARILIRRALQGAPTAWTGVTAYLVSLYAWIILMRLNPIVLIVVPALHSLQYLTIVKRYQTNRHAAGASKSSWRAQYGRSIVLGLAMFLAVPILLDRTVSFDEAALGALPFSFMFMIGINVHHYFLDNVMWRRGNPEVSEHLFA